MAPSHKGGPAPGKRASAREASPDLEEGSATPVFDLTTVGMVQADPETRRFLRVNRRFCQMTGYSARELLKLTIPDLTHPDDREIDRQKFDCARRGETRDYRMEKRCLRKDGTIIWLRVNAAFIRDQAGRALHTLGVVEDITESKGAVQELQEIRQRLSLIVEYAMDAIVTVDEDEQIVFFNAAAEKMFGCPSEQALGRSIRQFLRARPQAGSHARLGAGEAAAEGLAPLLPQNRLTMSGVRQTGEQFPVRGSISSVETAGGHKMLTLTLRDITRRVRAEQELQALQHSTQEASGFLEALQSSGRIGIGFVDRNLRFQRVNDAFAASVGVPASEHVGRTVSEVVPELWPQLEPLYRRVLEQGEPVHDFEISGHTAPTRDEKRHWAVSLYPVATSGSDGGFGIILDDLTERKQLEGHVLEVSQREQQRIGRDLHDDLCQWLVGTEFLSAALTKSIERDSPANAALAGQITKNLRQVLHRARRLTRGLMPQVIEGGLDHALRQLANDAHEIFRISCLYRSREPIVLRSEKCTLHLYRIAQEAITNAVRHGRASKVEILLGKRKEDVLLTIRDNGSGVPLPLPQGGMGLRTMRYRANKVGALLEIRPLQKGGTEVTCLFPAKLLLRNESSR